MAAQVLSRERKHEHKRRYEAKNNRFPCLWDELHSAIISPQCSGYAGGQKKYPTYRSIKDHTEAIKLEFDPRAVSYEKLVREFYSQHSPVRKSFSRQYRSAILYATDEQKEIAERVTEELEGKFKQKLYTDLEPLGEYYLAEGYHQVT
jgi:peptide-methionine (S)-S-oxide reductase